jgi:hypothetical protein
MTKKHSNTQMTDRVATLHGRFAQLLADTQAQLEHIETSAGDAARLIHSAARSSTRSRIDGPGGESEAEVAIMAAQAAALRQQLHNRHRKLRAAALQLVNGDSQRLKHSLLGLSEQRSSVADFTVGDDSCEAAVAARFQAHRLALRAAATAAAWQRVAEKSVLADGGSRDVPVARASLAARPAFSSAAAVATTSGVAPGGPIDTAVQTKESTTLALAAARAVTSGQVRRSADVVKAALDAKRPWEAYYPRLHALVPTNVLAVNKVSGRCLRFQDSRGAPGFRCKVTMTPKDLTLSFGPVVVHPPSATPSSEDAKAHPPPAAVKLDLLWIRTIVLGYGDPGFQKVLASRRKEELLRARDEGAPAGADRVHMFPDVVYGSTMMPSVVQTTQQQQPITSPPSATGEVPIAALPVESRWMARWTLGNDFRTLAAAGERALAITYDESAGGRLPSPLGQLLLVFEDQQVYDDFVLCLSYWCPTCKPRHLGDASIESLLATADDVKPLAVGDEITYRSREDQRLAAIALKKLSAEEIALCRQLRVSPMALLSLRKRLFSQFSRSVVALQDLLAVADIDVHRLRQVLRYYAGQGLVQTHELFYAATTTP